MAGNADKLNELLGRGVTDFGAVFHAAAVAAQVCVQLLSG